MAQAAVVRLEVSRVTARPVLTGDTDVAPGRSLDDYSHARMLAVVGAGPDTARGAARSRQGGAEAEAPQTHVHRHPDQPPKPQEPQGKKYTGKSRAPFYVPKGTVLLSLNKKVTSSDSAPVIGELDMIVDGEKAGGDGFLVELGQAPQWVQIDLSASRALYAILVCGTPTARRASTATSSSRCPTTRTSRRASRQYSTTTTTTPPSSGPGRRRII